jgi:hypothetical protein
LSTILKSLKKLEQEKEARQYTGTVADYHGPGSVSLHDAKHRWTKSAWFRRSLVVVVMLGLGASSLYFYSQSQDIQHQAKKDRSPQLTAKNTAKKPQQKTLSPGGDRGTKVTPRKPPASIQKPIKKTRPPETAQRTPATPRKFQSPPVSNSPRTETSSLQRRPPLSSGDSVSADNTPAERPSQNVVKPTPSRQQPAKPVKRTPAKAPVESYQNVSALTDDRLKVQAIVWSRIPEDRMTVINSRVLHEGDSVDGFTLVVIRPDDVVVKESGGARWKVLFGRP